MPRPSLPLIMTTALLALLTACGKKDHSENAPADATAPTTTSPATDATQQSTSAPPAAPSAATAEDDAAAAAQAKKQAQLDYATMEDTFINDPNAQWASSAKASSTFGDSKGQPSPHSSAEKTTGKVDGNSWSNDNPSIGFDWVQVNFDKAINATELRFVIPSGKTVDAISKVELIDTDGKTHVVWSGVSDVSIDKRGPRTWFVRQFDATPYKAVGAKLTIANNMSQGYKELDAVQIVGQ